MPFLVLQEITIQSKNEVHHRFQSPFLGMWTYFTGHPRFSVGPESTIYLWYWLWCFLLHNYIHHHKHALPHPNHKRKDNFYSNNQTHNRLVGLDFDYLDSDRWFLSAKIVVLVWWVDYLMSFWTGRLSFSRCGLVGRGYIGVGGFWCWDVGKGNVNYRCMNQKYLQGPWEREALEIYIQHMFEPAVQPGQIE